MKEKKKGLLADSGLLLAALLWGGTFPISKIGLQYFTPIMFSTIRFGLGAILLGIVFFKHVKNIEKNEWIGGFACGAILTLAFTLQVTGLQYINPSLQSFLAVTYVIMVPFLYWLVTRKKPDSYNIIAAFLTLVGIFFLTGNSASLNVDKGTLLTLISSVFYAIHIIVVGHYVKKIHPLKLTFMQSAVASILLIIYSAFTEVMPQNVPMEGWMSVLYMTVLGTVVAYTLQVVCQKYTSEVHAAIILSLEAVFGTLLSVLWLNDPFTPQMLLGCLIIFIALITTETKWSFLIKGSKSNDKLT